jgi:hypothetical protein
MPEYVMNRNHTIRSTTGRTITFKKGEPTWVPPMVEKEAIAVGAERVDGETTDPLAPVLPVLSKLTVDERTAQLHTAFEMLAERNDSKDFTAQGVPSVKAVSKIVDFEPERGEVSEAWTAWRQMKAEA